MIERNLEIVNRLGLHARAAAKLVHCASGFDSEVWLIKDGEEVDAKSILGILLLAAAQGSRITVRCHGEDEDEAMAAVGHLIRDGFGEDRPRSDGTRPASTDGDGSPSVATEETR